jgi:hypothetical protein
VNRTKLESKALKYRISLVAGETIKILVNDVEVFNEDVQTGFKGNVSLIYNEDQE